MRVTDLIVERGFRLEAVLLGDHAIAAAVEGSVMDGGRRIIDLPFGTIRLIRVLCC